MGCWGTGIFEDDLALDVRDLYDELTSKGYGEHQITAKVLELFKESIEDEDDGIIVYSALAVIQLSRSSLLEQIKGKTLSLIENESGMNLWKEAGKADYKARMYELNKLKKILSMVKVIPTKSVESNAMIIEEYKEPLLYSVYQLKDNTGQVVYIGSTAFPEKRLRYMNFIEFKKSSGSKGFFGILGSSKTEEEDFWEWFSQNEQEIFKAEDIADVHIQELFSKLKKIHPDLTIEFSPEADGKKTMAISADGISELVPYVLRLINEPKLLTKWIVVPFRQRLQKIDDMEIKIGDIIIGCNDIMFVSAETGRRIELNIYIKGVDDINNALINAVYLLLDSVIGEYDVITKIGRVEVNPLTSLMDSDKAQPLNILPITVDGMK